VTPSIGAAVDTAVAAARATLPAGARLIGVGWATVDLERAEAAVGLDLADADGDVALGARCRMAELPDGVRFVLLEPSTEGRLTATLARHGEGPQVTWWEVAALDAIPTLPATPGPLGLFGLRRGGAPQGPWRFLRVRRPATITP
jgi:hypothetical protein